MGVALAGASRQVLDPHPPARHGSGGQKIGSVRGVRLDGIVAGLVALSGLDQKTIRLRLGQADAEIGHNLAGDVNIGPGNKLALDLQEGVLPGIGRHHQQGRDLLAGLVGFKPNMPALKAPAVKNVGHVTGLTLKLYPGSGGLQHRQQFAHGPLAHAGDAVQPVAALSQRYHSRDKAGGGAGIAHK